MFLLALGVFWTVSAAWMPQAEDRPSLECLVGPTHRTYGGTEWLGYACNDQKTAVLVSAPGSPAMSFVFILAPQDENIRIYGEGNGDQNYTKLAVEELRQLSKQDLADLLQEAARVSEAADR